MNHMTRTTIQRLSLTTGTLAALFSLTVLPAGAIATAPGVAAPAATSKSATNDAASQAKLKTIISRGDKEITRRLKTLNTLTVQINSTKKLSGSNKTLLGNEVKDEVSGLTALKAKLDADTGLDTARTDAQSIFSGYRVYALIVPKVQLVKTADDQQGADVKLTALATKLQARLADARKKGKDVASLQSTLGDMTAKTAAAQTTSSSVESAVVNLQPSDYNTDHSVLAGDQDKLKTAQDNIKAATADAKTVVNGLKKL